MQLLQACVERELNPPRRTQSQAASSTDDMEFSLPLTRDYQAVWRRLALRVWFTLASARAAASLAEIVQIEPRSPDLPQIQQPTEDEVNAALIAQMREEDENEIMAQ